MNILFVISELYFSEPLGVMQLSAVCRKNGHRTMLVSLKDHSLVNALNAFDPDLVAYSTMTPDERLFQKADGIVRSWMKKTGKNVPRIMGGPHPTYFNEVLQKMDLDAICVGEGDNAILGILDRVESGADFSMIPNVIPRGGCRLIKEVIDDMDSLPFVDRELLYSVSPELQSVGIRSFLTQRGCPYRCTYCFNHAYNRMFREVRRNIVRRRSVDHLLEEIKYVVRNYPVVRFIRFADDVFVIRKDAWLEEFAERYPREIGIPFYCLIRANNLTEEVARLLSRAGCRSIGMSIESGNAAVRNKILKRNMPDELLIESFAIARKYRLNAYANTMMGLPGTTLEDDFNSFLFAKKLKPAFPSFGMFAPFPKTELTEFAIDMKYLDRDYDYNTTFVIKSVLNCYTEREKNMQLRLLYLSTLFCCLPDFMTPLLKLLIRLNLTLPYRVVYNIINTYMQGVRIFPGAYPRNLRYIMKNVWLAVKYDLFSEKRELK